MERLRASPGREAEARPPSVTTRQVDEVDKDKVDEVDKDKVDQVDKVSKVGHHQWPPDTFAIRLLSPIQFNVVI